MNKKRQRRNENMNNCEIELELIMSGDIQGVGYRQYVKRVARKLHVKGSVKNLEDETVEIRCKGEIDNISSFKDKINVKNPLDAPLIEVDEIISEKSLPLGTIEEKFFRVIAGDIKDELLESNFAGINYLNLFRKETAENFEKMIGKQDVMIGKQDVMIGKQNVMIKEMVNLRSDFKSYFDERFVKIEEDIFQIKKRLCLV